MIPAGIVIRKLKLGENIITRQTSIIFPNVNLEKTPIGALVPFKADIIKASQVNFTFCCGVMTGPRIKARINPSNIGIYAFLTP